MLQFDMHGNLLKTFVQEKTCCNEYKKKKTGTVYSVGGLGIGISK